MHLTSEAQVRRLARSRQPVVYVIFDLLYLDGRSLLARALRERRARLLPSSSSPARLAGPRRTTSATARRCSRPRARSGLEGIVAKRLDCPYEPGAALAALGEGQERAPRPTSSSAAGRWATAGAPGALGALAIGFYDDEGELRYAGKVGTGFTDAELKRLQGCWSRSRATTSPFTGTQPPKGTRFVEPELVAIVEYRDITESGTLRASVLQGPARRPAGECRAVRRDGGRGA